jgi:hypothetical protein
MRKPLHCPMAQQCGIQGLGWYYSNPQFQSYNLTVMSRLDTGSSNGWTTHCSVGGVYRYTLFTDTSLKIIHIYPFMKYPIRYPHSCWLNFNVQLRSISCWLYIRLFPLYSHDISIWVVKSTILTVNPYDSWEVISVLYSFIPLFYRHVIIRYPPMFSGSFPERCTSENPIPRCHGQVPLSGRGHGSSAGALQAGRNGEKGMVKTMENRDIINYKSG